MTTIEAIPVPKGSLLAEFGGAADYRDCFRRTVPNMDGYAVSLPEFIERFYTSTVFRPEAIVLGMLGRGASRDNARALACGEADHFGVWRVVKRREALDASGAAAAQTKTEILLESKETGTASWFAVEPLSSSSEAIGRTKTSSSSAAIGHAITSSSSEAIGQTKTSSSSAAIGRTKLYFGSWVGNVGRSGWRWLEGPHRWYSRMLLGSVRFD